MAQNSTIVASCKVLGRVRKAAAQQTGPYVDISSTLEWPCAFQLSVPCFPVSSYLSMDHDRSHPWPMDLGTTCSEENRGGSDGRGLGYPNLFGMFEYIPTYRDRLHAFVGGLRACVYSLRAIIYSKYACGASARQPSTAALNT